MEWWDWCDGAATLKGLDLEVIVGGPFDRLLNTLWALLVEQLSGSVVSPYAVLQELVAAYEVPETPTLATWGMSAEAQQAQEAMMQLR